MVDDGSKKAWMKREAWEVGFSGHLEQQGEGEERRRREEEREVEKEESRKRNSRERRRGGR